MIQSISLKKRVVKALIIVCFFAVRFMHAEQIEKDSIFSKVMKNNIKSLIYVEDEWPEEEFYLYIDRCMKTQKEFQEYKKRQTVYAIFDAWAKKNNISESSICNDPITWSDLNLFCGQSNLGSYFAHKIDRTQTIFGRIMLYTTLVQPTVDKKTIEMRQEIIKTLLDSPALLEEFERALQMIRESENMLLCFWTKDELKEFAQNYRYMLWPWDSLNEKVNRSQAMLTGINMVMHNTNVLWVKSLLIGASVMLPVSAYKLLGGKISDDSEAVKMAEGVNEEQVGGFLVGKLQKWTKDFVNDKTVSSKLLAGLGVIGGICAGLNIKESFNWARAQFAAECCMHIKLIHMTRYVKAITMFNEFLNKNNKLKRLLMNAHAITHFFEGKNKDEKSLKKYLASLHHSSVPDYNSLPKLTWYSLISTLALKKGNIFVNYRLMNQQKEAFENSFAAVGEIDMYVSLANLYKEHMQAKASYSFVQCVESEKPFIDLQDFWNPFLDSAKVVVNSLTLGKDTMPRNMIVTGPNAGGKSTILKAAALSLLMAQSFGIAPCKNMIFSPFSKITTYLNIEDDIGAGKSLFKAQALRAQQLLDSMHTMKPGEFGFMIVDEMFNGTNPMEAEAAAYSVAKSLGESPQGICIIATHFSLLTNLGCDTNLFANYNVSVVRDEKGGLQYPFKLCPGISEQHIAIEILRSQGFKGSILDNAENILKNRKS